MKKTTLIAFLTLATSAVATPIDLGKSKLMNGTYIVPWSSGISSLDGQTMSMDLTFTNDEFVRIFETTSKSFIVVPFLILHGTGTINNPTSSGFTTDASGEANSIVWSTGGGSIQVSDETFGYGLGYVYPMFVDDTGRSRTDVDTLDFYGLHFDITLPDSDFEILGASFLLAPTGGGFSNFWAIGDIAQPIPDSGSTVVLLGLSIGLLLAAKRRRIFDASQN